VPTNPQNQWQDFGSLAVSQLPSNRSRRSYMPSRDAYLNALSQYCVTVLEDPTAEAVAAVAPYLEQGEVQGMMHRVANGGKVQFAAPPVLVKGTYHLFTLEPPHGTLSTCLGYRLLRRQPLPIHPSYVQDESRNFGQHPHADRAMNFALQHWGEALVADDAVANFRTVLQDPTEFDEGRPKTIMVIYCALRRSHEEIVCDQSAPQSNVLNEAIVQMTHFSFVARENRSYSAGDYNCSRCGGILGLTGCDTCKAFYSDDGIRGARLPTVLPARVVDYAVALGHNFTGDLQEVRETERQRWRQRKGGISTDLYE
jgi:hypothetical protein